MSNESQMKSLKHGATQPEGFWKEGDAEGGTWLETRGGARKSARGATVSGKILIHVSGRSGPYLPECAYG